MTTLLHKRTLQIIEESNYYPFGLKHKGYNNVTTTFGNSVGQKFGFTGKEHQDELGLGWIDITARNYDPALGRWMNLDPLAEQGRRWSPYNYAMDNPIYFQDPDGLWPNPFQGFGEGIARSVRSSVNKVSESISKVGKSIKNGLSSIGNNIASFFTAADKDSSQGGDGYNFVSKDGTNKGQRKGDNSVETINADDIIGSAKSGTSKFNGIDKKNILKTLKNGISDGETAVKLVEKGIDAVSKPEATKTEEVSNFWNPKFANQAYQNGKVVAKATINTDDRKVAEKDSASWVKKEYNGKKIDSIQIIKIE